jgi:polyhydroxyalkanoate synthesis regulator phasin
MKQQMAAMQANRDIQHMTMKNMTAHIETNTREICRLKKEVEKLKNHPSEKKD